VPETPSVDDEEASDLGSSGGSHEPFAQSVEPEPHLHHHGQHRAGTVTSLARSSRGWMGLAAGVVALAVAGGAALILVDSPPTQSPSDGGRPTAGGQASEAASGRTEAVQALLEDRAQAILSSDRDTFLDQIDPSQTDFATAQRLLIDRLAKVPLTEWQYEVVGAGPTLDAARGLALPDGSAVVHVRLSYRVKGSDTQTDREQYLTVVPRGGRWLLAGDTDGQGEGFTTQRDLWDLGPVRVRQAESGVVLADTRAASPADIRRLADETDRAVRDVDRVWRAAWSRRPLVILPDNQQDIATLIGSDGKGLGQIAAVTTGSYSDGVTRGDRVVINPGTFATLRPLGRRVVLSHEMTHLAARASSVQTVPIWLSEGFADYVAYDPTTVPVGVVAGDVFERVRDGDAPRQLPDDADFDAGSGDIAAAYESAWLACRMISERWGERALVRFYTDMADSAGPGWPGEVPTSLGIGKRQLVRQWRQYVVTEAAAS
jgi:hypothetical protein